MSNIDVMTGLYFGGELAVVPVFVNTGAALLPALIAGLASFVTILFKPKQLVRVCREKPYWPIGITVAAIGAWAALTYLPGGEPAQAAATKPGHNTALATGQMMSPDDWMRLAHQVSASQAADRLTAAREAAARLAAATQSAATQPATTQPATTQVATTQVAVATPPSQGTQTQAVPDRELYFRGSSERSGHLGGPSPTNLKQLWNYSQEYAMFWSSPIVRGGRVYSAWCALDPPESYGAVICVDAMTGKLLWQAELKNATREFGGFFSSPALTADGKFLVIGQGLHPDYDSELVCIDTQTGTVKWLIDCPLHIESSPAIVGDIVVVGAGAIENPSTHLPKAHSDPAKNKNPGYVFAARISTGEIIWKHVLNDPESSPAVADGVVYIGSGFNGKAVVALRLSETDAELKASGKSRQIWKTATPHPATGAITLADDAVLVGCGNGDYVFQAADPAGAVMALDKKTGKVMWSQAMPDGVLGPIAARNKTAIVPVRNGEIVALDIAAKDNASRILWKTTARKGARALAGPAFTNTNVYAVTHDGYLVVMDAKTGAVLESLYINADPGEMGMSIASPIVANGRVYVGSETGGLRCYENKN